MSQRLSVFFYGLFMDPELLRSKGCDPQDTRRAMVHGMALQLRERATLIPCPGGMAHGVVMSLSPAELGHLYSEPSVAAYVAGTVTAHYEDGTTVEAECFNLPQGSKGEPSAEYATKLKAVAAKMGLPGDYVRSI